MKGVIVGLFVFMMMLSFAVAQSSSSVQTNFYIQEPGMEGGYEEDVIVDDPDNTQTEWISKVVYWGLIIIAVALLLKVLKGITGKPQPKVSKKRKAKRSRRKKK